MTPTDYKAKREHLLDCAYRSGTEGNLAMKTEYMERVGRLDAEYSEQCRKTMRYEEDAECYVIGNGVEYNKENKRWTIYGEDAE